MTTLRRVHARPLARLVIAGAIIALLASCQPMNNSEANLFVATNKLREANGLPAYAQQERLMAQARAWAGQMASGQTLSHSDPYGWNVQWTAVAENVGTARQIETIIQSLEASPEHRAHMLSTKYTHMAVGSVRGKDGKLYVAQLFWRG
jgi:uncharacterized protein YkwD